MMSNMEQIMSMKREIDYIKTILELMKEKEDYLKGKECDWVDDDENDESDEDEDGWFGVSMAELDSGKQDFWEEYATHLGYSKDDIDWDNSDNSRTYFKDGKYIRTWSVMEKNGKLMCEYCWC